MSLITKEERSLFHAYSSEFERGYLLESAGQKHLALYKKERDEVALFWSQIKEAKNGIPRRITFRRRATLKMLVHYPHSSIPRFEMEGS